MPPSPGTVFPAGLHARLLQAGFTLDTGRALSPGGKAQIQPQGRTFQVHRQYQRRPQVHLTLEAAITAALLLDAPAPEARPRPSPDFLYSLTGEKQFRIEADLEGDTIAEMLKQIDHLRDAVARGHERLYAPHVKFSHTNPNLEEDFVFAELLEHAPPRYGRTFISVNDAVHHLTPGGMDTVKPDETYDVLLTLVRESRVMPIILEAALPELSVDPASL